MEKISSFCVDHDFIIAGIYILRIQGDLVTYDLRTRIPNAGDFMDSVTMHTLEHMFATYIRNGDMQESVIYFGPMGCRTGFYLIIKNQPHKKVLDECITVLRKIIGHEGEVFGNTRKECGNYKELDLACAKSEAEKFLKVLCGREQSFKYPSGENGK